jgi:hypothetical protein
MCEGKERNEPDACFFSAEHPLQVAFTKEISCPYCQERISITVPGGTNGTFFVEEFCDICKGSITIERTEFNTFRYYPSNSN